VAVAALAAWSAALAGFGPDLLIEIGACTVGVCQLSGTSEERQRRGLQLIGYAFAALALWPQGPRTLVARRGSLYVVYVEASQKDWLGGRQFDVDRYLHGATLEETVATGVYCLVTGKRRDSNVYFVQSGETWDLVDTAWRGRAELIRSAAETLFGVGTRPRAIVLTHVHPDHAGSASELARMWDVAVYVHPDELPLPPSGRIIGALASVERRWMFPSGQVGLSPIDPDVGVPGLPDWQVIPTPGHTPGHLALFREGDRALIPGDAVLTVNLNSPGDALSQRHTLGGPPRFATWNWQAATESVSELVGLEPSVLAPGHGRPMAGPVLAPALRALAEQLTSPDSAAGHKLTGWAFNFFDYSRRAR
jgi:glyoxylase-like metal-dependent hydrolase (beta-lactamase superfamily II)